MYIPGRYIGESVRLISDILEYTDSKNCEGYMSAADIEKAFDSLDHNFILAVLEKMGLGSDFIQWVRTLLNDQRTLLNDQQSCVMNNGTTTGYFNLNRGTRQGDPLSAYSFALAIEVLFIIIRENVDIKSLNLFGTEVKLTACADDKTIFLRNLSSLKVLLQTFEKFERVSSLRLNLDKSEICGIGVKKRVQMVFCGCKIVNLNISTIKILGVHFSYNEQLAENMNFVELSIKLKRYLEFGLGEVLTLSGRTVSFKALALSKIVYVANLVVVPERILNKLESIHKNFIWKGKKPKIKHSSLIIADYTDGGQKDVDISSKIKALQLVWVRRLFEENFHLWKLIPLNSLSSIGTNSLFHSNLHLAVDLPKCLPNFYKIIIQHWI